MCQFLWSSFKKNTIIYYWLVYLLDQILCNQSITLSSAVLITLTECLCYVVLLSSCDLTFKRRDKGNILKHQSDSWFRHIYIEIWKIFPTLDISPHNLLSLLTVQETGKNTAELEWLTHLLSEFGLYRTELKNRTMIQCMLFQLWTQVCGFLNSCCRASKLTYF